ACLVRFENIFSRLDEHEARIEDLCQRQNALEARMSYLERVLGASLEKDLKEREMLSARGIWVDDQGHVTGVEM
ncbi:MAG: hypothetical protein EBZ48_15105, partial [Proteobacteria bacterium]|nr:hypothetical protein [Pseudomonadota bacterium]